MKTKSNLFLAIVLMIVFIFAAGGCTQYTGELTLYHGLYPYQTFYIYAAPLWTTDRGCPNHDETINYEALTGTPTGKNYLIDDDGLLAFGSSKQQWILMAEEEGLAFGEDTLKGRGFAIRNVATGRFINIKGLSAVSIEYAVQGQQILLSDFEPTGDFFCRITPRSIAGGNMYNANISLRGFSNIGMLSLLGHSGYQTMKPSGNNKGRYAVQFLYGNDGGYDPENTVYSPDPQSHTLFCFTAD